MKHSITVIVIALCALALASCHTTTKIAVSSAPNARIVLNGERYTADNSGTVKMKIDDDTYDAFAFSTSPNHAGMVPFALDYNKRHAKFANGLYQGLGWTGFGVELMGGMLALIGLAAGDEDLSIIGGDLMIFGIAMATPGILGLSVMEQKAYDNQFRYLRNQRTNHDLTFTKPNITYRTPPHLVQESKIPTPEPAQASATESIKRQISERATKHISSHATNIEGVYTGSGSLAQGNTVIERYQTIKVIIRRIDNNTVAVNVEEGGEKFFANDSRYTISRNAKGDYVLTNQAIGSATITIDATTGLTYSHPRINIDGEIFSLQIQAQR